MLAVHYGAGNIGRGFIGQLLHQAGYEICFVDVNQELVEEINNRKEYTVVLAAEEKTAFTVTSVRAVNGKDEDAVAREIAKADLVTTAIGPNILKFIAPVIAKGISLRLQQGGEPLNVIACENMIGGSSALRSFVYAALSDADKAQADKVIGFPDAAVDRIVPLQKNDDKLLVTVEPFYEWVVNKSQIVGAIPAIDGVTYVDDLKPFIERKLFTVNTGHATVAYLGYLQGLPSIDQAMKNPDIVATTQKVLHETGAVLVAKYGFDREKHEAYINKILKRFTNPYISDEVTRVGRSPVRKLSPADRLVSPATQAAAYEFEPVGLATVIAAALLFDYQEDPEAVEVQGFIRDKGIEKAIEHYTGVAAGTALFSGILAQYNQLKTTR
ncbi:mannitol-1-phosphate 5-dehydrogenase [Propionispora hippei]|uniref:Mannitol-1-phosphate 5-dehydrogenase n=1 Tax=Propionispora hippei DSM 15287 TaxID=1123003 RepID=A0A1M6L203_9FIRM|nr:mannitol-1-phosphate 5-dehydrogenase [Propionispora hippei]SHJ65227.1 mannitol-1-phosphate 5-dehydrogenase [Propionispora hippei DSM 15287]